MRLYLFSGLTLGSLILGGLLFAADADLVFAADADLGDSVEGAWPQWRGPLRNGISTETAWTEQGDEVWRKHKEPRIHTSEPEV